MKPDLKRMLRNVAAAWLFAAAAGTGTGQTFQYSYNFDQSSLPECLEITAWTRNESGETDEIMGVRHRQHALEGVQFHPESILTAHGHDLLRNFLNQ